MPLDSRALPLGDRRGSGLHMALAVPLLPVFTYELACQEEMQHFFGGMGFRGGPDSKESAC